MGLYVSGFDPMSGRYPKNVTMLDVFVILVCVCICMCTNYGPMLGRFPRNVCMFSRFRSDVGQGQRNVYMFIIRGLCSCYVY